MNAECVCIATIRRAVLCGEEKQTMLLGSILGVDALLSPGDRSAANYRQKEMGKCMAMKRSVFSPRILLCKELVFWFSDPGGW